MIIIYRLFSLSFSGIIREQYFIALRDGEEIKFVCEPCVAHIPPRDNDGVEVGLYMYANENLLYAFANNSDVDQPSFPRILICVMRFVRLQNDNFLA